MINMAMKGPSLEDLAASILTSISRMPTIFSRVSFQIVDSVEITMMIMIF